MSGKRAWGYRAGDLAEGVGVELLRVFSLVALVPRTEDVGLDVLATLLRPTSDSVLIAEAPFYVQIRSVDGWDGTRCLEFLGDDFTWFKSLQQPYFFLGVWPKESRLALYSPHRAYHGLCMDEAMAGMRLFIADGAREDRDAKGIRNVWLGDPILTFGFSGLGKFAVAKSTYPLLAAHVKNEARNIRLRSLRTVSLAQWKTGQVPRLEHTVCFGSPAGDGEAWTRAKLEHLKDAFNALSPEILARRGSEDDRLAILGLEGLLVRSGLVESAYVNMMYAARAKAAEGDSDSRACPG